VPGIIAYGLFWAELEDWIAKQIIDGDRHPAQDEIDAHIQKNLTERYFQGLEDKALQLFGEAALDLLEGRIEAERQDAVQQSILGAIEAHNKATLAEVSKGSNIWRQGLLALGTALLAPIFLGLLIVAYRAYSSYATPTDVQNAIEGPATPGKPQP
jgi:hypothetical protein